MSIVYILEILGNLLSLNHHLIIIDVWKDGDEDIYQEQLILLADYIIDNHLWDKYNTSLFSDSVGFRTDEEDLMNPVCGTGGMYCVDAKGDIYNCVRFMDYSLDNKQSKKIGDIYNGIDLDKIRPIKTLFPRYISDKECRDCKVNHNCTYCAGHNYDVSENDSMFYRATAICKMFKAHVKANNYYWARLYNEHSIVRDSGFKHEYFMYFILSSDSVNYCKFMSASTKKHMKPEDLLRGLEYAYENFYQPVFVHSDDSEEWINNLMKSEKYGAALSFELKRHIIKHIKKYNKKHTNNNVIYVIDDNSDKPIENVNATIILNVNSNSICNLAKMSKEILPFTSRININIIGLNNGFDLEEYEKQLKILCEILYDYLSKGEQKEIRQLTDRIFVKKMNNCFAGEKNISFAPDGEFYLCPAFYFDKNVNVDINKSKGLTYIYNSPGCDNCDAYQCERCIYKNYVVTGELNTSSKIQCIVSHLERKYSKELLEKLKKGNISGYDNFFIPDIDYNDPVEKLFKQDRVKEIL